MRYTIIGITLLIVSYVVTINYIQMQHPNYFGHFTRVMGNG